MGAQAIDLSAGLVPSQGTVDLSAGLVPKADAPEKKGFWQSAYEATPLPIAASIIAHPINAAKNVAGALGLPGTDENQDNNPILKAIGSTVDNTVDNAKKVVADYKSNSPTRVHDMVRDAINAVPVAGPVAQTAQAQYDAGDHMGAAGTLVGTGVSMLGPKALSKVAEVLPEAARTIRGGGGPGGGGPPVPGQNYAAPHAAAFEGAIAPATAMGKNFIPQQITPEALTPIRATAARMAQQGTAVEQGIVQAATSPSTPPLQRLGAYQKVVQTALDDLEAVHAPVAAKVANVPVDTTDIVRRLQSLKSPTMSAADSSAIDQLIAQTKGAQTIGDLGKFRQELNVSTSPEYRQSAVQSGRSGLSAQAESDLAGWVRNAYYDNLQQATGTDFAPLKRQEANLLTVQEALQNQTSPLAKAEATFNAPSTLKEKAGEVANVIKEPKTTVTQTLLRESPATKTATLLRKSLADLPQAPQPTPPTVPMQPQLALPEPPAPQPQAGVPYRSAGWQPQLPAQSSGAYQMPGKVAIPLDGPPAMTAGERSAALNHWLRQRRQLGLPAQSSGAYQMPGKVAIPLDGPPAMTAGERSAALNHWLRQRRQLGLPAKAAPIPLPPGSTQ